MALGALVCSGFLSWKYRDAREASELWLFSPQHRALYQPEIESWNAENPESPYEMSLLSQQGLERRLLSGFFSDIPVANLVEVVREMAPTTFAGPLEKIGFVDLTDRIEAEGINQLIEPAAFSPWTSRGRIFGLPHDMHTTLLAYRSDIIEGAGIDLSTVETWDDLFAALRPLQKNPGGDDREQVYALNFSLNDGALVDAIFLQAGGQFFDARDRPTMARPRHAEIMCRLVNWVDGPNRVAIAAPEFRASGNYLKLEGLVLTNLMPDWLCSVWKKDLPQLGGKLKLMPLPAWEPGGPRTTVIGGTMLGITKSSGDFENNWALAKKLYLSEDVAINLYRETDIVTPISKHWDHPVFAEPDPYFSGQRKAQLYIDSAPDIPQRTASPYNNFAKVCFQNALLQLRDYARENDVWSEQGLLPKARELLEEQQSIIKRQMSRNAFLSDS
jgi:arabinosaccharide transport system substrate-binding protein